MKTETEEKIINPELSKRIFPEFQKSFAKLEKAAKKLSVEVPTYKIIREFQKVVATKIVRNEKVKIFAEYLEVEITGIAPKLSGWNFVSKVDFSVSSETGVFATVPNKSVPENYFNVPSTHCDHCGKKRHRKTCYLVERNGVFVFVGSSCLKDFLGHVDPNSIARFWSWFASLEDLLAEQNTEKFISSEPEIFELRNILERSACAIRLFGWRSSSQYDEKFSTTKTQVSKGLFPLSTVGIKSEQVKKEMREEWNALNSINDDDRKEAELTFQWLSNLQLGKSDYENNLFNIFKIGFVNFRSLGLAVSSVKVAIGKEREKSSKENEKELFSKSNFVGEIKTRQSFDNVLVHNIKSFMGNDFYTGELIKKFLYTFISDGDVLVAFPSSELKLSIGEKISIKATPTKHEIFNGASQTTINRIKIQESK